MNHSQSLPEPSKDALAHSEKLIARIREEIAAHDGAVTFRRYMEMALYEPALGYYVTGTHKIGAQGDFVTAPEISPLFSQCIAQQCQDVIQTLQQDNATNACILELGAGSGKMAADILLTLEDQNALPAHYYILDLSPDLKQRQKETLEKKAPHLIQLVTWLTQLPEKFEGIIIGNEVLDAMPVDVFTQLKDKVFEHHVIWQDDKLVEQLQTASDALTAKVKALNIPLEATPYTSEINPNLDGWFKALANCLDKGVVLLADYGYPQKEYYLADRNKGTLICHYQHLVNEAPLLYSGLQDITANVDFTAVAESADLAGFDVAGFTSQASFLSNTGLEKFFMQALDKTPNDQYAPNDQYKLAQQVRTLSMPSEMGERFKFIALSKAYKNSILGFNENDQRYRL